MNKIYKSLIALASTLSLLTPYYAYAQTRVDITSDKPIDESVTTSNTTPNKETHKIELQKKEALTSIILIGNYNAKILGFAKYCKLPDSQISTINNFFESQINEIRLTEQDKSKLQATFKKTFTESSQGLKKPTNFNCESFKSAFDDIYQKASKM